MKKFATILFSIFYLQASVGIAVDIHYCNGQVKFVEVIADIGNCCCGDEENTASCCDDETFFFQLDNVQKISQNFRVVFEQPVSYIAEVYCILDCFKGIDEEVNFEHLDLLQPKKQPIWLLNCSLTYYG